MTSKGFMAAILIAGSAVAATSALAMGPGFGPRGAEMNFDEMDADNSGEVSRAELRGHMEARFGAADSDGDGVLSRDEMIAAAQARIEEGVTRMIERFDDDGDGAVSLAEMPRPDEKRAARMFDVLDSDDSGGISREEFAEMREHMSERRGRHGGMRWHKN